MQNFHGSWFLTLEFSRGTGVTQLSRIFIGEIKLIFTGISKRKVTNLKIPVGGEGFEESISSILPLFGLFLE